jgi:hypothetical protein
MTTTVLSAPVVSVTPVNGFGFPLDIVDNAFTLTLDEGNAPFLKAQVIVTRPDDVTYALLEPMKREPLVVTVNVDGVDRISSTMYVYDRTLDPEYDRVALTLTTRENDLQTYSPFNVVNLVSFQSSVRNICQQVVRQATGIANATVSLVGGAADASFRVFSEVENLALNPKLGVNGNYWNAVGSTGGGIVARNTNNNAAYPFQTYARLPLGSGAASSAGIAYSQAGSFTPGQQYTFTMYGQVSKTGGNMMSARLVWMDSTGAEVGIRSYAATRATTSNWSQRFTINATAPANAAAIAVSFYAGTGATAWVAGDVLYATALMILEGDGTDPTQIPGTPMPYFDGVTADTADYHYGWADTADASTSKRTPLVQRPPENLLWSSGVSGYDFVKPILDAVGLRLFLRQDGVWCLADNGYTVPGQLAIQYGSNLYEGSELLSIGETDADGFPMNADAVILRYSWTDAITGAERSATDTATTASYKRPWVQDIDLPFPGPGQAKFLLQRLQARRYRIDASVRPDWTARPGMTALISLANRPAQTGYVQALEFDVARGVMDVTTKGLITAFTGSVGKAPITQTIGSVAGTIAAYTN